ncbi:MAG: hypothetical protein NT062_30920 [Proteobacteria bacterium]|nr:hypothetical protein [Pseudomonadota bacterium]
MTKDKKKSSEKAKVEPEVEPKAELKAETKSVQAAGEPVATSDAGVSDGTPAVTADDPPTARIDTQVGRAARPTDEPGGARGVEIADEVTRLAAPPREKPNVTVESPRARTMTMSPNDLAPALGKPPEMPTAIPPINVAMGGVEDPTHMPGPRAIPGGHPADPAAAPGLVPRGDSRSLRNVNEFALIYRLATFVITRSGTIGTRGQWRVVEYPTSASASHAYAKECSRFVSDGFSDYRG